MKPSRHHRLLIRSSDSYDAELLAHMERLHRVFVAGRWVLVLILWVVIGIVSTWSLRHEFAMVSHRFTWAAVRYGLAFNIWPTLGLSICIGPTVALLVWQTRNLLWGLPKSESLRLQKYVLKIRDQGPKHPLWGYVFERPVSRSSSTSQSGTR